MMDVMTIRPPLTTYRLTQMAEAVGAAFQVSPDRLLGADRGTPVVSAARLALYTLLYERTSASLPEIGRRLGRDHTTVLKGVQRVQTWKASAPAYHAAIETLRKAVLS